jgi:hypothetical protein
VWLRGRADTGYSYLPLFTRRWHDDKSLKHGVSIIDIPITRHSRESALLSGIIMVKLTKIALQ